MLDTRLAAHFPPARYRACATASLRRFVVSIQRPDGTASNDERTGGTAAEHAAAAMDEAGIGSVVRVLPIEEAA